MKTIQNRFKILTLLLFIGFALSSCSSDDSAINDENDNSKTAKATAVIGMDNKTIQFSGTKEKSFATIMETEINDKKVDQLFLAMIDETSGVWIITLVVPGPGNPKSYDLSNTITNDYFFSAQVAVKGKASSEDDIYGVGTYQGGEEIVRQSKGMFKISAVSQDKVKGSFTMTLYNNYDPKKPTAEELTATKGTFDLPIVEMSEEDLKNLGLQGF